jgi:catechol 2,3-dioxygenase-like lactoylglutathione lyase family enzyme
MYQSTSSTVTFLYDHRGGRRAVSLELVRWIDPPTAGTPYPHPWCYGLHSVAYSVPDIAAAAERVATAGGRLVARSDRGLLLNDPEDLAVEVIADSNAAPGEAHHFRLVCADIERSAEWYQYLGLQPAPHLIVVPGAELWPGEHDHAVEREVGLAAADDPAFGLVLTSWSGPRPAGPSYAMPFHQGLYRLAIAVDDVRAVYDWLSSQGVARQPPYTFELPGTPFGQGLTILFLRDPDGVLVELVERPRSAFPS